MIYLNDRVGNINNLGVQQYNSQPKMFINKNYIGTDSVSFSGISSDDNTRKKNKIMAGVIAGLAIIGGIILLAKKGKISPSDAKKGADDLAKKSTSKTKSAGKNSSSGHSHKKSSYNSSSSIKNKSSKSDEIISKQKPEIITEPSQNASMPQTPKAGLIERTGESEIKASLDNALDMYAEKLSKDPDLKSKTKLIREVLPDLTMINDKNQLKQILKIVTPDNKEFILKQAIPTVLRNETALSIKGSTDSILEVVTPDNIDILDKLAVNAKKYRLESEMDTRSLLEVITKGNKDFAINDVIPFLADNADRYKIRHGCQMAGFIEAITPQNKDFMFNDVMPYLVDNAAKYKISNGVDISNYLKVITHENKEFMLNEVIPKIIANMEKLCAHSADIPKIAKLINKNNINNIQIIADNIDKFKIKDKDGFFDFEKFVKLPFLSQNN